MGKLIHEDLSYVVRGVLFDVHTKLGPRLPEQFYQDAVGIGLEKVGITCQTEKSFDVHYKGVAVGRYFIDVWIEHGKLLLELKVSDKIEPLHRAQAIAYLKGTDSDLAMVVNFGEGGVEIERFPNFMRDKSSNQNLLAYTLPKNILFPELTHELLAALHCVHGTLQPGFLHQVYRRSTFVELRERAIGYQYIKKIPISYHGQHLGDQDARLILVDGKILLATIAVKAVEEAHKRMLRARMRLLNAPLGLIANFNSPKLNFHFVR